jgi:hypothetical protein
VIAGAILAVLALLATACASVPVVPASDQLTRHARSFSPPPGQANVYVIRGPRHPADQPVWTVDLDFRGFGTLPPESYLYGWIAPGVHVLAVLHDSQVQQRVRFRAKEGQTYFFTVVPGLLTLFVERVDEETGRALVTRFRLSGDNRFEGETLPAAPSAAR